MSFSITANHMDCKYRLTPPSPLPRHEWHGYGVTSAHHEEVGVSADGHASAPPLRGRRHCAACGRQPTCSYTKEDLLERYLMTMKHVNTHVITSMI
jgi:hypothetical protein